MSKGYKLSTKSKQRLVDVHPDMVKVVERALELSPYDFGISEGVRSLEKQKQYVAEGKSKTLNSKHLRQETGYSHAVDIAVYVKGQITWEVEYYRKVAQAFFTAAIELGVQIESGVLWSWVDGPHFNLNDKYY